MHSFDICLMGDCDYVLSYLVKKLGWELENAADTDEPLFIEPNNYLFKGAVLYDSESEVQTTTHDEDDKGSESSSDSEDEDDIPQERPVLENV
jgi:hypothetical protein